MDGDGDLDLAVGNYKQANQVYRNENDGSGHIDFGPEPVWKSIDLKLTESIAWGDADGDGNLDLAIGNDGLNQIYRNDGKSNFTLTWESKGDTKDTQSLSWGDADGDGDLDLAIGNDGLNQIYRNDGKNVFSLIWDSTGDTKDTQSLSWGDADGDGDLDLIIGNDEESSQLHINNSRYHFDLLWQSSDDSIGFEIGEIKNTMSTAWGDMDGDGDLDLATGNIVSFDSSATQENQIYRNNGNGDFSLAWSSDDTKDSLSVAWGDMDGDGDLDLAIGNGDPIPTGRGDPIPKECGAPGRGQANQLYRNDGDRGNNENENFHLAWESSNELNDTRSVAWGDMDNDGDLDLAVGNLGQCNQVYRNSGNNDGEIDFELIWKSKVEDIKLTTSVAWGDMDNDGDLDLAVGNISSDSISGENQIYQNNGDGTFSLIWESIGDTKDTRSIAWGDADADGDLDLAIGNNGQVNQIYRNNGQSEKNTKLSFSLAWESVGDIKNTWSIAWGDVDRDGDLDLAMGNGSSHERPFDVSGQANQVYFNNNKSNFTFW